MKKSMSLSERCRKEWREVKSNEDPKHRLLALAVIIGNVLTPDSIIICFFFSLSPICGEFDELDGVCSLEIEQRVFWNHETMKAFKFQPSLFSGEFLWEFNKRTSCESETIPPDRRRLTLTLAAPMTVQQPRDRWPALSWHYWHDMHKALNNRVEIFPVIPSDAERNKKRVCIHYMQSSSADIWARGNIIELSWQVNRRGKMCVLPFGVNFDHSLCSFVEIYYVFSVDFRTATEAIFFHRRIASTARWDWQRFGSEKSWFSWCNFHYFYGHFGQINIRKKAKTPSAKPPNVMTTTMMMQGVKFLSFINLLKSTWLDLGWRKSHLMASDDDGTIK